jgi:hypothetical protein
MQTEYGVGETYPDSLTPTHCVSVGTYQFCLDREEVSGEKTTHEFVIVMKMQCIIIRNRSGQEDPRLPEDYEEYEV